MIEILKLGFAALTHQQPVTPEDLDPRDRDDDSPGSADAALRMLGVE